jgi:hypothetical protein
MAKTAMQTMGDRERALYMLREVTRKIESGEWGLTNFVIHMQQFDSTIAFEGQMSPMRNLLERAPTPMTLKDGESATFETVEIDGVLVNDSGVLRPARGVRLKRPEPKPPGPRELIFDE